MFDKDRFHNALALSLGYERIFKDKRITIKVDEAEDPWVTLKIQGCPEVIRFNASCDTKEVESIIVPAMQEDIGEIIDAVHQAYKQATTKLF